MRTAISELELVEPKSLKDALKKLATPDPPSPIAGCTDVFVGLNFGTETRKRFLNLWGLDELRKIELKKDLLSIGALATHTQIIESSWVKKRLPMLALAAGQVGGVQIQNRGTIGGNIANASPAGDTLPVLAVAEATVVLQSLEGIRRIPFASFYTGYRKSVMRKDELIVAIEIAPLQGKQWFRKVGTRAAQAISKIVMAGLRAPTPRIALGSVAPTVVRAPKAEAVLSCGGSLAEAQRALMQEIRPIDDIPSTATYRRQVAANLLARFWKETG